jgi:hypothetical protein
MVVSRPRAEHGRPGAGGLSSRLRPTIARVDHETPRPAVLGGFRSLLAGGVVLIAVLVYQRPIIDPSRCPNAGAAGNASAFADPAWDRYLPELLLGWLVPVLLEQALPVSWRHRGAAVAAGRAAAAVALLVVLSCVVLVPLETVCR